jgi:UDP-N-acetylmuramate--alanine ligase
MPGVTSELVANALREAGGQLAWRGERDAAAEVLAKDVRANDVVVMIGAGDITRTGPELLKKLSSAHS